MALLDFRKNDKDEEGFVPSKESVRDKKNSSVSGKTRRSRGKKELLPVWTKKERYLVIYVLSVTIIVSTFLALSARSWKLPNMSKIDFSKLAIFNSDPIVIERKNSGFSRGAYDISDSMKENFWEMTDKLSGIWGLYVVDLQTGFTISVNEDERFEAASLIKLPVMASAYLEDERENFNLDLEYVLKVEDKVAGSGSLYSKPAGAILTYRELVALMGQESDNTAYRVLLNSIGQERVESLMPSFGMYDTSIEENTTTLSDVARFFGKIWDKGVLSSGGGDEILEYLTDTLYESWIPQGTPGDVRVSHKFGREVHVINDAGIVYTSRPYVIVILTKGIVEREADEAFPQISGMVFRKMLELESQLETSS